MELRQLRHFLEVLRCASFRRAAEQLNLSQPALSKSVRALETNLGVQLLERSPAGVAPTEFGRVLADYATLVDGELVRAREELESMRGAVKGTVRVGASTSLVRALAAPAVRRFMAEYPDIALRVTGGLKDNLVASLRRGELDLVITVIGPEDRDDELTAETLLVDRQVIVAAADHPLAGMRASLDDLAGHGWIVPGEREPEDRAFVRLFTQAGLPAPRIVAQTTSSLAMAALMPGTRYLSYLPRRLLTHDPVFRDLTGIESDLPPRDTTIAIVTRTYGIILPVARAFIRIVGEEVRLN